MEITLNHNREVIDTDKLLLTVNELLAIKKFTFELLIVRINGILIKKENYSSATITNGDIVEVIHVFGGG
jgi:thiamine biosynthesis protein ThiS